MFIEVSIQTHSQEMIELLIAELAEVGFESFVENENCLQAYIAADIFDEGLLIDLQQAYDFSYEQQVIEKTNWNEEWEKNYQPVEVADKVRVRAIFHEPNPKFGYEILITPKMSFGTGHHETTSLMLETQLELLYEGKRVLDAGCGTGILAIMAFLLGAKEVEAFDNDEWAIENTKENIQLNKASNIRAFLGTIENVLYEGNMYGIILANINKNVLLKDIPSYAQVLEAKGDLLLSGFYEADVVEIEAVAKLNSLSVVGKKTKNNWVALHLKKS